jgi:hypothetical protein
MDNEDILKSRNVLEMLTVANDFCIFTESVSDNNKLQIFDYYQKVLPLLYVKGALVPDIEVSDHAANERFITEQQWQDVYKNIQEKLGKDDAYWTLDNMHEATEQSIADNISDIYQDMKDFLILFQQPKMAAKENAVNEIKKLFESHWGIRCTKATDAIHQKKYDDLIGVNENPML